MNREPIMEMLREYGINSEEELAKAMKHLKPLNIAVFVTPVPKKTLSINPAQHDNILIRREDENGQDPERACV